MCNPLGYDRLSPFLFNIPILILQSLGLISILFSIKCGTKRVNDEEKKWFGIFFFFFFFFALFVENFISSGFMKTADSKNGCHIVAKLKKR